MQHLMRCRDHLAHLGVQDAQPRDRRWGLDTSCGNWWQVQPNFSLEMRVGLLAAGRRSCKLAIKQVPQLALASMTGRRASASDALRRSAGWTHACCTVGLQLCSNVASACTAFLGPMHFHITACQHNGAVCAAHMCAPFGDAWHAPRDEPKALERLTEVAFRQRMRARLEGSVHVGWRSEIKSLPEQ